MNPEALRAFFEKNKKGLAAAGAIAVVGLALVSRRGKSETAAAAPVASSSLSAGGAPTSSYPVASQYTGGGTYDSTASDVYGALAPMLERNNALLTKQMSPIPVTAPPQASKLYGPSFTGSYLRDNAGAISEVQSDGSLYTLNGAEWAKIRERDQNATAAQVGSILNGYRLDTNIKQSS